jgi:hypothetical protein
MKASYICSYHISYYMYISGFSGSHVYVGKPGKQNSSNNFGAVALVGVGTLALHVLPRD